MSHHQLKRFSTMFALLACAFVAPAVRAQQATQPAPMLANASDKRDETTALKSDDVKEFGQQTTTTTPFTPAPSSSTPQTPSTTTTQTPAPSANTPPSQTSAPPSNAQPLTPDAQTQQSVQPAPQGPQQPSNPNASQPSAQPQAPVK